MPHYTTENIRNIAFVGQLDSGKTTLSEAMLLEAGVIGSVGTVERGSTVSDFDPSEKEHQHSLNTSIVSLDHNSIHINIIDAPGLTGFRGPSLTALSAVETALIVLSKSVGLDTATERMMIRANERGLCRMIVINKIDVAGVDLETMVRDIREKFGNVCLPINLPANEGRSVTDCFYNLDGESDIFSVAAAHSEIIDQVVEVDEAMMERYLEQGTIEPKDLHDAFEKALREGHLVPICFTSAKTGVGVAELLNVIEHLMPNPCEGNPPRFLKGEGASAQAMSVSTDADKHVVAHVFKISNDPFAGKLSIMRLHQGTINKESQLFIGDGRKPFKVGHLFKIHGKDATEIDAAIPGDICAVTKADPIHYDAILHDSHEEDYLHLQPLNYPKPMYGLAIFPKSRGNEQKLSNVLQKLEEEDVCFKVEHNIELNETVIRGLGDLHLRILLQRMKERFNVDVTTHAPRIAYRETISRRAEGHSRHKKQTGGAGQFGEVFLRVEPLKQGEGSVFKSEVVGGAIPSNLIPAVEKGVRQVLLSGALAGYLMQDIKIVVYDGKHHAVDSKEIAFVQAGKKAFIDAIKKASALILEPIVDIEITVPDSKMGDISGALSVKRARINGTESIRNQYISINAQVPLSEISEFHSELKAMTAGEGQYSIEFSHYEPVPSAIQNKLMKHYNDADRDDD